MYDESYVEKFYRHTDERGRFQIDNLTGAGRRGGDSGKPWRGADPDAKGRHWAVPLGLLARIGLNGELEDLSTQEKLDFLEAQGLIYWPPGGGMPRLKRYLEHQPGLAIQDIITDIGPLSSHARERLGYPTQKPLALLERIIAASSNEGDLVLDPFCGCGTTVHAAQKLNRRWIGVDVTHLAIRLVRRRLVDAFPQVKFDVQGVPKDLDGARELAARDKHQFELWALSLIEAQPFKGGRKGADSGIDGYLYFKPDGRTTEKAIVEVKGGENVSPQWVRALNAVVERERAKIGVLVTLAEPTVTMRREAAAAGLYKTEYGSFERLQILTVEELIEGKRPHMPWIDPSVFRNARRERTERQGEISFD